jgi:hypothetical protein
MNFQKLFGPLTKSREDVFDDIIGHENMRLCTDREIGKIGRWCEIFA